jgi:hypothetical protein
LSEGERSGTESDFQIGSIPNANRKQCPEHHEKHQGNQPWCRR